jgi:hypothetical protein
MKTATEVQLLQKQRFQEGNSAQARRRPITDLRFSSKEVLALKTMLSTRSLPNTTN